GRGDVADIVVVEQQERAEIGGFQRRLRTAEPIAMHAPVIDALLEVDPHGAEHRQVPAPIVARVDVLGGRLYPVPFGRGGHWGTSCSFKPTIPRKTPLVATGLDPVAHAELSQRDK